MIFSPRDTPFCLDMQCPASGSANFYDWSGLFDDIEDSQLLHKLLGPAGDGVTFERASRQVVASTARGCAKTVVKVFFYRSTATARLDGDSAG